MRIGAPFFGELDSTGHRIVQNLFVEVASLFDNSRFTGFEYGAVWGGEGEGFEFLLKGEQATHKCFTGGRNLDRDGGCHKTSLSRIIHESWDKVTSHVVERVSYKSFRQRRRPP